ncbi:hypothetical protein ncot_06200 [Nocardioides sp. JQ2195]|uniref:hypothetical protein n=1 Tax=Nocardioides sp. JQ2195 TaxID=2592334 RepID=UPI00143EBAC6|nr:hypothetical protein [Nocardioides sp. JQ2195]QIX26240.1 hypothetical protein ncot_06200 [Nocardioides sp. JQ2195]
MPGADEFSGPVDYASQWLWWALGAFALVVVFYLVVLVWSLLGGSRPGRPVDLPSARARALAELDRIGHQVHAGEMPERLGHQQMSVVVRGFVSDASGLPALTMALADLRAAGIPHLAETIALMYPPEFSPSGTGDASLQSTLDRARDVVSSWS